MPPESFVYPGAKIANAITQTLPAIDIDSLPTWTIGMGGYWQPDENEATEVLLLLVSASIEDRCANSSVQG